MREGASLSRAGRRRAWRREEEKEEEGQWDPWRQMVVMAAATQTELKAKAGFHADPLPCPRARRMVLVPRQHPSDAASRHQCESLIPSLLLPSSPQSHPRDQARASGGGGLASAASGGEGAAASRAVAWAGRRCGGRLGARSLLLLLLLPCLPSLPSSLLLGGWGSGSSGSVSCPARGAAPCGGG